MSESSTPKKTKTDDAACVKDDATIPVNTVARMIHLKVAGEVCFFKPIITSKSKQLLSLTHLQKEAVQAEAILRQVHETMMAVDGFQGANRFICKEHWDVKYFARLSGVKALTSFMDSAIAKEKIEPMIKELQKLSKDSNVHVQNFVAEDWK